MFLHGRRQSRTNYPEPACVLTATLCSLAKASLPSVPTRAESRTSRVATLELFVPVLNMHSAVMVGEHRGAACASFRVELQSSGLAGSNVGALASEAPMPPMAFFAPSCARALEDLWERSSARHVQWQKFMAGLGVRWGSGVSRWWPRCLISLVCQ